MQQDRPPENRSGARSIRCPANATPLRKASSSTQRSGRPSVSSQRSSQSPASASPAGSGRPSVSANHANPRSTASGARTATYATGPCGSHGEISIIECSLVPLPCSTRTSGAAGCGDPHRATIGSSPGPVERAPTVIRRP